MEEEIAFDCTDSRGASANESSLSDGYGDERRLDSNFRNPRQLLGNFLGLSSMSTDWLRLR
jgi:hypothetical protein